MTTANARLVFTVIYLALALVTVVRIVRQIDGRPRFVTAKSAAPVVGWSIIWSVGVFWLYWSGR